MRAALITLLLLLYPASSGAADQSKTFVQLWTGGDDGLTQSFSFDMRTAIDSTPGMTTSIPDNQKPDLVIEIVSNVRPQWPSHAFTYKVSVEAAKSEKLYEGLCEEGMSAPCATGLMARIVKELDEPPARSAQ